MRRTLVLTALLLTAACGASDTKEGTPTPAKEKEPTLVSLELPVGIPTQVDTCELGKDPLGEPTTGQRDSGIDADEALFTRADADNPSMPAILDLGWAESLCVTSFNELRPTTLEYKAGEATLRLNFVAGNPPAAVGEDISTNHRLSWLQTPDNTYMAQLMGRDFLLVRASDSPSAKLIVRAQHNYFAQRGEAALKVTDIKFGDTPPTGECTEPTKQFDGRGESIWCAATFDLSPFGPDSLNEQIVIGLPNDSGTATIQPFLGLQ